MSHWNERAEQYRTSDAHREGPDLDRLVEWAEPGPGVTALDVATGGGHVARRLREAGCTVVSCDPAPGMQADVICRAEYLPFDDASFDVVACRVAAHHFEDVGAAVKEMARVARGRVIVVDTTFMGEDVEQAEKLRDPSHVRNYDETEWRALFAAAGLEVEEVEFFDKSFELQAWLDRTGCEGEDAERATALLGDRVEDGLMRLDRIALKGGTPLVAIIVDRETRLVVQGLTGSEGRFHGVRNRDYGTQVVAGVTPGKGGQDVEGIPVFDTVSEAVAETGANTSMIFVPARFAADAIYEGVDAGITTVVCIAEGLPAHEMLRVYTYIRPKGITMIGPNCPGALSPGKSNVGIIPAEIFREGAVGLVSRSGTLTYQIGHELTQLGLGNSTIVGIGGDPVVGSSFIDVLERFEADPETELVVMVGRDRRRRGGEGRPLHPGVDDEAGAGLHRRLLRAAREDDGPRGRDHLGLVRDGAGEEGRARGVRGAGRDDADRGRADGGRPGMRRRVSAPLPARSSDAASGAGPEVAV